MRLSRLSLLSATGLVAFILLGTVLFTSQSAAIQPPKPPIFYQTPGPMRPAAGLIPPAGSNAANLSAIPFSTQDVRAFILAHGFIGGPVVPGHTLTIVSIQLLTPQQADAQGAELEAYTSTKMVFVVNMEGPFYTTNVKSIVSSPANSTAPRGYEIFDAHTGDMLEWGL